jgi:hypothetical protein
VSVVFVIWDLAIFRIASVIAHGGSSMPRRLAGCAREVSGWLRGLVGCGHSTAAWKSSS